MLLPVDLQIAGDPRRVRQPGAEERGCDDDSKDATRARRRAPTAPTAQTKNERS